MANEKMFSVGDMVSIADLKTDSGSVEGVALSGLPDQAGEIVEVRMHPPHVDPENPPEDLDPSPHALVELGGRGGKKVQAWFALGRLSVSKTAWPDMSPKRS